MRCGVENPRAKPKPLAGGAGIPSKEVQALLKKARNIVAAPESNEDGNPDFSCRFCHIQLQPGKIFDHEANCVQKPKVNRNILVLPNPNKPIAKEKTTAWRQ